MRFNDDFIELEGLNFVGDVANRGQAFPCRVRSVEVVPSDEFSDQMVEMMLAEDHELRQTFELDHLNESFPAFVQIS